MPKSSVKVEGVADLKKAFAGLNADVKAEIKAITRDTANSIRREARGRINIGPGKLGKHTRDQVRITYTDGGLGAEVGMSWFIGRLLEFGHFIAKKGGIGARAVKGKTTVVGRVPARPWLFPAFALHRNRYLKSLEAALYGTFRRAA